MNLLFPARYRLIGLILFVPAAVLGTMSLYGNFEFAWLDIGMTEGLLGGEQPRNWTNELAFSGILIGLALFSFSRMKVEDEWIQRIRQESFILGFQISLALLFVANLLVFSTQFFFVMIYNMFTPLIFFNLVFWAKYRKANKDLEDEA